MPVRKPSSESDKCISSFIGCASKVIKLRSTELSAKTSVNVPKTYRLYALLNIEHRAYKQHSRDAPRWLMPWRDRKTLHNRFCCAATRRCDSVKVEKNIERLADGHFKDVVSQAERTSTERP